MSIDLKSNPASQFLPEPDSPKESAKPKPPEIAFIPIDDLVVPDWNPRPFIDEVEMQNLMEYIKRGGHVPRGLVWKGNGQAPWMIISGQRRREARKRLGFTDMEVEKLDIPLEDAMFLAISSNKDDKPYWLGEFIAIENLMKRIEGLKQKDVVARLGWPKKRVSYAVSLTNLLSPASRQLIYESARQKVPTGNFLDDENTQDNDQVDQWRLTEGVAIHLIPLWDKEKAEESRDKADKVVKIIVNRQLEATQTQDLVAKALRGEDFEGFKPAPKVRKPRKPAESSPTADLAGVELTNPSLEPKTPETEPTESSTTVPEGTGTVTQGPAVAKHPKSAGHLLKAIGHWLLASLGWVVRHLWHSFLAHAHRYCREWASKVVPLHRSGTSHGKSGQDPFRFLTHYAVYGFFLLAFYTLLVGAIGRALGFLYSPLGQWIDSAAKYLARLVFIQLPLWALNQTLHTPWLALGLGVILMVWIVKTFRPQFFTGLFIAVLLVAVWVFRGWWTQYLPVESSAPAPSAPKAVVIPLAPVPTTAQVPPLKVSPKRTKPTSVVSQQSSAKSEPLTVALHAWNPSDEDRISIEEEIGVIPQPCLIKEFQMTPDSEMSVDMATRRVNDLQDVERYTTLIGRDRHKVVSATPNPSGLTLAFDGGVNLGALAGALSGGLVGGASNNGLEIYWEDLKGIHCNKIQTLSDNLKAIYQIAFVVPGMKKLLIVQCASADDCERLVSALQFWVRTAKKGTNAPMSGLPYLNQGVLLGDGNKVNVTWVGSPIDKSGLITGDHIWGVDQNPAKEQGRDELQTSLQNLPSGNHTLYSINPDEWKKLKLSLNTRRENPYHAKLEKVSLSVP